MVKYYDCGILYHPEKTNVVFIEDLCLRMLIVSQLLDLIKKEKLDGLKKDNWKEERIKCRIPLFIRVVRDY